MSQISPLQMRFPAVVFLIVFAVALFGCTEPDDGGTKYPNNPPQTRLSNVPPPGIISSSPLLTLSWLGDDADGYVVAYRYRWSFQLNSGSPVEYKDYTYILNITIGGLALILDLHNPGDTAAAPDVYQFFATLPPEGLDTLRLNQLARGDTVEFAGVRVYASNPDGERYPTHQNPSRGTFIFDSQDTLNPHTFEVAAIDNNGWVDPDPATVDFFTPLVDPPDAIVTGGPALTDTVLILDNLTDTYDGIEFTFQGFDPNSRTIEYSWVVDRDLWPAESLEAKWSPFSLSTSARIKGSDLPDHYATSHRIYVRARNEFGSISTRGYFTRPVNVGTDSARADTFWAYRNFNTVYPLFARNPAPPQRILLIMNVFNWDTLAVLPYRPSRADVRQYYIDLYNSLGLAGKYDIFDVEYTPSLTGAWPGLGALGQYSMVHVVGDVVNEFNRVPSIANSSQTKLIAYCYAGGKLLMNGWNLTRPDNMPANTTFWNNILHIANQFSVPVAEYIGARHQTIPDPTQYPDAPLDMAKLDTAWHGALPAFNIYQAYGFGQIAYRYDALHDNAVLLVGAPIPIENGVLGIRYLGLTYDSIYLGFPLYYTEQAAALEVLRRAFQDLKHL
jgi:hypothetical protein